MTSPLANETVDGIGAFLNITADDETFTAARSFVDSFETHQDLWMLMVRRGAPPHPLGFCGGQQEEHKTQAATEADIKTGARISVRDGRNSGEAIGELKDRQLPRRGQDFVDLVVHVWKQLTTCQREVRQRVEVENVRLRSKLEGPA